MTLTLESIYRPVNQFFINKFQVADESPVFFRFDKFGSVIADVDFVDPETGEAAPDAQETFSDITNRIPIEDPDQINVYFGSSLLDSTYRTLLNSSIPFADKENPDKDQIISAFNKIKAEADRQWEFASMTRSSGTVENYRASFAFPSNWYNRTSTDIWTSQSFEIRESVSTPASDTQPRLWKLKLAERHLKEILPTLDTADPIKPIELRNDVTRKRSVGVPSNPVREVAPIRTPFLRARAIHKAEPAFTGTPLELLVKRDIQFNDLSLPAATVPDGSVVTQNFRAGLRMLDLTNRLAVLHYVRDNAPTQPSSATSLKINFDYCQVNIRRPWLLEDLTRNKSWYLPGITKGQESKPGFELKLSALPVGFVAIKNLIIEANWSQVDIDNSKNATDFGPFEVSSQIVNNRLSHEGIQIIGWILQRMPELPPNDPPQ